MGFSRSGGDSEKKSLPFSEPNPGHPARNQSRFSQSYNSSLPKVPFPSTATGNVSCGQHLFS
jgi:hypothetical protein